MEAALDNQNHPARIPELRFPLVIPYEKGVHVLPSVFLSQLLERFRREGLSIEVQDNTGARITDTDQTPTEQMGALWHRELLRGDAIYFKYRGPEEPGRYFNFLIAVGTALREFIPVEAGASNLEYLKLPPREEVEGIVARAGAEITNQLEIWIR